MAKTVVGIYRSMDDAEAVVRELQSSGFNRDDISLISRDPRETKQAKRETGLEEAKEGALGGAGLGAVLGGAAGLLAGLGALTIPGIGPIVAAGPIAAALGGAGIGAAAGGIAGALIDMGIPDEDAEQYAEGVSRGGTLVSVRTEDHRARAAADILERHNPMDVRRGAAAWSELESWGTSDEPMGKEGTRVPIVEEHLRVGTRRETGGVRVEKHVVEEPVEETIHIREERIEVRRHDADRPARGDELDALQDESFEVRTSREEPVVQKEARVVGEVEISKDVRESEEKVHDRVRRTEVRVEDLGEGDTEFKKLEPNFRQHYNTSFSRTGRRFEDYRPAYEYGYRMRRALNCNGACDWDEVWPDARRDWERNNPGFPWHEAESAIRQGFEERYH